MSRGCLVVVKPLVRGLGPGILAATLTMSPAPAQTGESATFLLPACQLYLRSTNSGQRLRLERGVCIGVTETVLRLHRRLRAAYDFCPPKQVTLRPRCERLSSSHGAARTLIDHSTNSQLRRFNADGRVDWR